ncbi:MAG: M2 family metallopeptidase [Candidatus Pacearchaeota archaeon]|nr:M2 family metallopeptidase [Candidatus Pacearchaeota archaeon]
MDKVNEIKDFLENQNKEISKIYKKLGLAYFNAITSGKEEFYKEYEKLSIEMENFFHNMENFEKIKAYLNATIEDKLTKRQLKLLHDSYLGSQGDIELIKKIVKLSAELEKKFNTFRAEVKGKKLTDNEIKEILKTQTDSKIAEEAWSASKKQGEVVSKELIELVKMRNQLAKSLGFENYYKLSLEVHEQKEEEIEKIFLDIENKTNGAFKNIKMEIDNFLSKKFKIKEGELKPWHYQDLFFQETPEIQSINLDKYYKKDVIETAKKFYKSIGIDVSEILEKSDLYEKEGKYQHACCIDMDKNGDTRIVENVKNDLHWIKTTLHELGHGIYNLGYAKENLPFLLKDAGHIFVTEAIAQFFEREARNSNFINTYSDIKLNEKELKKLHNKIKKEMMFEELVFCRWSLVMFNFERELYKNPEQDLNRLWWGLVKKYQMIDFYRDKPDWASKIHLVSSPVYYHNYLLGRILASQIHNYIIKNITKQKAEDYDYSGNKEIGNYLNKKLFSFGTSLKWDELIKKVTGEDLNPEYWTEQFIE